MSARPMGIALATGLLTEASAADGRAMEDMERIKRHFSDKSQNWTWVFYGDSITQGAKHTEGWRDFSQIFAERVRFELRRRHDAVVNSGNSGQNSRDLLDDAQYEWQVRRFRPDVVFVMVGMNDSSGDITVEEFKHNLSHLVDRIRADKAIPVLQTSNTIQKVENQERHAARYRQLPIYMNQVRAVALEKDVILVDHFRYWDEAAARPEILAAWLGEAIHPGAKGHQEMAVFLLKTLDLHTRDSACSSLAAGGDALPPAPASGPEAISSFSGK